MFHWRKKQLVQLASPKNCTGAFSWGNCCCWAQVQDELTLPVFSSSKTSTCSFKYSTHTPPPPHLGLVRRQKTHSNLTRGSWKNYWTTVKGWYKVVKNTVKRTLVKRESVQVGTHSESVGPISQLWVRHCWRNVSRAGLQFWQAGSNPPGCRQARVDGSRC